TQRLSVLQDEVARARAEVAALHRRLEHSEALRAKLQGHLFESEGKGDAQELMRLRREVAAARERIAASEQTAPQLRARVDDLVAALAAAQNPQDQVELLLRLGRRGGGDDAFYAVRPWATAEDPNVRAAAYQSLGRLLERDPARLEPHVRWGIADANPHVRRRV